MERPTIAVGAICVRDGQLLLIRRRHAPARGRWSLPGGRVEIGELLADALVREVREETGLQIEVGALAGILEVPRDLQTDISSPAGSQTPRPGDTHYVILDYFVTVEGDMTPLAADDAAEAKWVALGDVTRMDLTPRFVETLRAWGVLP